MHSPQARGIYCNPTLSFDRKGSFHNLGEYDGIDVHFVDEQHGIVDDLDEEQGFEAVLDVTNLGRGLWDSDLADSESEIGGAEQGPLYQREKLEIIMKEKTLNSTYRRDAIFKALEAMGIKTFIVVSGHEDSTSEILQRVRDVIDFVSILKTSHNTSLKCCLLFQDTDGLLYNLLVPHQASGPFSQWQSNMNEFSGIQAMSALAILARILPCIGAGQLDQTNPAFFGLIMGLILTEEMTLSWLNASLFVQGIPSTSSYQLLNKDRHDWIHKAILACLIFAGASSGDTRILLLIIGVSLACVALLANMGSRAWHFFQFSPVSTCGPMTPLISFLGAVAAGIFFPHMGHREIECGGKPAIESIVKNAFFVSTFFALSSYESIQRCFLAGAEGYNQNIVSIAVGSWILCTMLSNLVLAALKTPGATKAKDPKDRLLFNDQYSPVGYRVPTFPSFVINPSHEKNGLPYIQLDHELYFSVFVSLLIMGAILSMAFTGWHKTLESQISKLISNILYS